MYAEYSKRNTSSNDDLGKYIEKHLNLGKEILPYATIAARLFKEFGVNPLGKTVTITAASEVPVQKGYASSAICSTSFAMVLIKASGKKIDDQKAIDVSRDGERIVHRNENAGRIDVGPAYYGGYVIFSSASGVLKEGISTKINVVVFDTGPKPPTAEMVKKIRDLYNKDTEGTTKILHEIDSCVTGCIDSLKVGNLVRLGEYMSRNHELLAKLGVSSERLDRAVSIAVDNGAYGAKLCGGGGGGIGIALVGDNNTAKKVTDALKKNKFDAYSVSISLKGAKSYL